MALSYNRKRKIFNMLVKKIYFSNFEKLYVPRFNPYYKKMDITFINKGAEQYFLNCKKEKKQAIIVEMQSHTKPNEEKSDFTNFRGNFSMVEAW